MVELRPVPIILIAFYCFLLGLFFFSVTANTIFSNNAPSGFMWLPVATYIIFASVFVAVGIGILYYHQLSWKVIFFFLMIFISTVASLILVAVIFLWLDQAFFFKYYQDMHITPVAWFSFLAIFLSGIIVLYYLTHREVVSCFGKMDEMTEPF
jgi:hypothetical protein